MKKLTSEVLDQAVALRETGLNHGEIMAQLGLSHSQMERHFFAVDIEQFGGFLTQPATLTEKAIQIAKLRTEGQSWGVISVRFKEPESRTRRHFKEAGGLDSKGMRIGKGGRYVSDDPRFYTGSDRAKLGTELIAAVPIAQQVPDPNEAAIRVLPKIAKTKVRKPRAKRVAKKA